ncbi:YbaY family lipoprotein [Hymenobacter latericus]|uniref:YbaY family lipoprotein n=1 Tax=Hymenobacter sp. YIM 151858-1 TaxID=2987688 RepID=UPI0022271426|nr:YbaY family lipoprotein [Hymenobacter sp. YIM 151858-1]UYZ59451.1 YbaY family lipoprotein [Hymenobacter sp. YIM 151858-1]
MNSYALLSALGAAALLGACTGPSATTSGSYGQTNTTAVRDSVTGTVAYRERIALPPNAVLRVQLQDVSRQDAPAVEVASATVESRGRQVPLPFVLRYDTARIDPTNTYAVQARIEVDGRLMFTNDSAYPVITRGNPKQVQMMLRRAAGQ